MSSLSIVHLSLVVALEYLSTTVSSASVDHFFHVVDPESLSTAVSSCSVGPQHLSTAELSPSAVLLFLEAALGRFVTAASCPSFLHLSLVAVLENIPPAVVPQAVALQYPTIPVSSPSVVHFYLVAALER